MSVLYYYVDSIGCILLCGLVHFAQNIILYIIQLFYKKLLHLTSTCAIISITENGLALEGRKVVTMLYTITNTETDIIKNAIYADSLEEAYLKALLTYGIDAIGCNVEGENGDFSLHVCNKVWVDMLNRCCPTATMVDVFNYCLAFTYMRLGKMTREQAMAKSRLWRWMDRTGFMW